VTYTWDQAKAFVNLLGAHWLSRTSLQDSKQQRLVVHTCHRFWHNTARLKPLSHFLVVHHGNAISSGKLQCTSVLIVQNTRYSGTR